MSWARPGSQSVRHPRGATYLQPPLDALARGVGHEHGHRVNDDGGGHLRSGLRVETGGPQPPHPDGAHSARRRGPQVWRGPSCALVGRVRCLPVLHFDQLAWFSPESMASPAPVSVSALARASRQSPTHTNDSLIFIVAPMSCVEGAERRVKRGRPAPGGFQSGRGRHLDNCDRTQQNSPQSTVHPAKRRGRSACGCDDVHAEPSPQATAAGRGHVASLG